LSKRTYYTANGLKLNLIKTPLQTSPLRLLPSASVLLPYCTRQLSNTGYIIPTANYQLSNITYLIKLKILMGNFWRGLKGFALGFGVLALVNYKTPPALSAETVVVRFGILSESFSLKELQYVSETGKFPDGFEIYTSRLSQEQRQLIIKALRTKVPVNIFTMSKLLNTQIGTTILKPTFRTST
jgi:Alpha/beta hydrolase of unknown function (DUF1400)